MTDDLPAPQIFPLCDGGLQAEWHVGGYNVEIEVEHDGLIVVSAEVPALDVDHVFGRRVVPPKSWGGEESDRCGTDGFDPSPP